MLQAPVAYLSVWQDHYSSIEKNLNKAFGTRATRIDHIGSTAVPGLVAKPVIDVQVTVDSLAVISEVVKPLEHQGFYFRADVDKDRPPPWERDSPEQWRKAYFKSNDPANVPAHIHVRESGRKNQRYALLFRDYLRSNPRACDAYGSFKLKIAELVGPKSESGGTGPYLDLKDPVFDLIADSAERWAGQINWSIDSSSV